MAAPLQCLRYSCGQRGASTERTVSRLCSRSSEISSMASSISESFAITWENLIVAIYLYCRRWKSRNWRNEKKKRNNRKKRWSRNLKNDKRKKRNRRKKRNLKSEERNKKKKKEKKKKNRDWRKKEHLHGLIASLFLFPLSFPIFVPTHYVPDVDHAAHLLRFLIFLFLFFLIVR